MKFIIALTILVVCFLLIGAGITIITHGQNQSISHLDRQPTLSQEPRNNLVDDDWTLNTPISSMFNKKVLFITNIILGLLILFITFVVIRNYKYSKALREKIATISRELEINQQDRVDLTTKNIEIEVAYEELTAIENEMRSNYSLLEKKQAELEQIQKQYHDVVEDQTELICRYKPNGELLFANQAFCRYFRLEPDNYKGIKVKEMISLSEQKSRSEHYASITKEHPVKTIIHKSLFPGEQFRWQEWADRAIFNEQDQIIEYQSVGRDITERVLMRENLMQTKYSLNHMRDLMIWCRSDGTIIDTNSAVTNLLGFSQSELSSMNIMDIICTDCNVSLKEFGEKVLAQSREGSFEKELRAKDQTRIIVEIYMSSFKYHGHNLYLLCARDIRAKKTDEALIKQAFTQIEKNIEYFSILNDQIRNPLTILLTLSSDLDKDQFNEFEKHIHKIDEIVDKLDKGLVESEKVRSFLRKHYYDED